LGTVLYVERNVAGNIARMAVVNDLLVANDETVSTRLDLDTGPAQMAVLSGVVELPPGVDEVEVASVIEVGDAYVVMDETTVWTASPEFALSVPLVVGAQYRIRASKTSLGTSLSWAWSNLITAPASDIALALPAIGDMVSPSGPIGDTSPTFTYTEVESTNHYSALVIKGSVFAHIAMGDKPMVSIP